MSVELSKIWSKNNTGTKNTTDASSNNAPVSESGKKVHIISELRNLMAGQTFSGEIVGKNGSELLIMLDKDTTISAKLERELNIAIGQIMSFEVKSNNGSSIALIPLFENLAADPNILKALMMANLPFNGKTEGMVESMMKEGMSIDKSTLQSMYKQLMSFPSGDITSQDITNIVEMNKLQIPMTENNLEQYSNYKNFEHKLLAGIQTVFDDIPKTIQNMIQTGDIDSAAKLFQEIIKLVTGESVEGEMKTNSSLVKDEIGILENPVKSENLAAQQSPQKLAETGEISSSPIAKETVEKVPERIVIMDEIAKNITESNIDTVTKNDDSPISLPIAERKQLVRMLQNIEVPEKMIEEIKKQSITPQEILQTIADAFLGKTQGKENAFKEFFGSDIFRNILRSESEKQFLLKPEQVGKENKVEEYYQRLNELTNKLTQSLESLLKGDNPLMKTAANLQNNVDFMNQLNQTFTYLQLPLKMGNKNANGDLYVYTNKKNLAKKDGNVSAFLHLDMEYMGAVDIHVTLQEHKVTTKFYLEKEEIIDLVEKNMHRLDVQLEKKGYHMTAEVFGKEKEVNVVKEMLEQNKNIGVMSKYSFDMRA